MNAGYASRDITPAPGLTLSGFAARCNRPSDGVDDPLTVHALCLAAGEETVLLLVFDLLALGPELTAQLHRRLDDAGVPVPAARRLFCCTHTHSAPASITLIGCGIPDPGYWDRLCAAAADAAVAGCRALQPATLRLASVDLEGVSYYRRQRLANGRVVMPQYPAGTVVKGGPVWTPMRLLRFDDAQGAPIAGLLHWAAHPACACGPHVSADFPGELCRRLSARFALPFLFLQGACGDINPPYIQAGRGEMLQEVDAIMRQLDGVAWPADTCPARPFDLRAERFPLPYAALPGREELARLARGMGEIAATGDGPAETVAVLGNILNVEPGEDVDPAMLRYIAGSMQEWAQRLLEAPAVDTTCDIALAALRLGDLLFCFVAAETFVETAIALQDAFPGLTVLTVGYASPLVGYLPTDEALGEGGYEVDSAYRFYAHPAPFAPGGEPRVRQALIRLAGEVEAAQGSMA